jgi:long-chain fatty acid transport protein
MATWGPPAISHATGIRLPDQDAAATARGEAFAATADNPSAIYYNPAGITQLPGHQVRAGVYGLYLDVEYNDSVSNQEDLHAIPQVFYTFNPDSLPLAFGLGLYSPYGLSSEWPEDSGFRTVAIEGDLKYWTLAPVVAWEIVPNLSIAAGPTLNYSRLELRQGIFLPAPGSDSLKFQGDGTLIGVAAGLLWKVHPKVQFGVSYRSETMADYGGSTEAFGLTPPTATPPLAPFQFSQSADARLAFPQNVVVGVSYRPTPDWNLEVNVDWTDWERVNSLTVRQEAAVPPLFPQELEIPLGWESSFYYEFGVTRRLSESWSISAGYIYNENSVPDENYMPLVADLDRHFGSVGATYQTASFGFSVAYQFGYGPTRTVEGSAPSLGLQTADGDYKFLSHAVSFSAGVAF